MNLRKAIYFCILTAISLNNINGTERIYDLAKMGLKANSSKNASPVMQQVVNLIKTECNPGDSIILRFAKGSIFFMKQTPLYALITSPITIRPILRKLELN